MKSWHDYHITHYEVDSLNKTITFRVAWPYDTETSIKNGKIKFTGVIGYHLENDAFGNIILSFESVPIETIISKNKEYIENSFKWSGAFADWAEDIESASEKLKKKNIEGYILSSSIGLSGWLLVESVEEGYA